MKTTPEIRAEAKAIVDDVALLAFGDRKLSMDERVFAGVCATVVLHAERDRCASIAEQEPCLPGSPWKALGFRRALRLLWAKLRHPFKSSQRAARIQSEAIAKKIRDGRLSVAFDCEVHDA